MYAQEDIAMCVDVLLENGREALKNDQSNPFKQEEQALLRRLGKYKENYLAWIYDFSLPTTNNLSERSLRFVKTKDKVSGQFQNIEHCHIFCQYQDISGDLCQKWCQRVCCLIKANFQCPIFCN